MASLENGLRRGSFLVDPTAAPVFVCTTIRFILGLLINYIQASAFHANTSTDNMFWTAVLWVLLISWFAIARRGFFCMWTDVSVNWKQCMLVVFIVRTTESWSLEVTFFQSTDAQNRTRCQNNSQQGVIELSHNTIVNLVFKHKVKSSWAF